MHIRLSRRFTAGLALAAATLAATLSVAQTAPDTKTLDERLNQARASQQAGPAPRSAADLVVQGVTQPSERKELAFPFQGIIAKVSVKDGDPIKVGQELMRQDDRLDLARLEGLKLAADPTIIVRAKQSILENKRVQLTRSEELYKKQALTITELQQARLDVVTAEAEVDQAKYEALTKQADVKEQTTRIEKLTLMSTLNGVVQRVIQTEGEVADIQKASIVVVKNDPMWIDIKTLRTPIVQRLKKGDTLAVRYPGDTEWRPATINFIDPVADARADTQAIRLEMPNPDNRSTGLGIDVKIPSPAVASVGLRP